MRRFLHLFRRSTADRELAAEMREHLDEKIEELVAAGMSRDEATAEARRRFGNPASAANSATRSAVSGVCGSGFSTTAQPAASAGASFHVAIISG